MEKNIQKRTSDFSLEIIAVVGNFPKTTIGFELGKQLLRSGTSIGANVVEGDGAVSKREFINYMEIAKKSAKETRYWLFLSMKAKLLSEQPAKSLLQEVDELTKILSTIALNCRKKNTFIIHNLSFIISL